MHGGRVLGRWRLIVDRRRLSRRLTSRRYEGLAVKLPLASLRRAAAGRWSRGLHVPLLHGGAAQGCDLLTLCHCEVPIQIMVSSYFVAVFVEACQRLAAMACGDTALPPSTSTRVVDASHRTIQVCDWRSKWRSYARQWESRSFTSANYVHPASPGARQGCQAANRLSSIQPPCHRCPGGRPLELIPEWRSSECTYCELLASTFPHRPRRVYVCPYGAQLSVPWILRSVVWNGRAEPLQLT